MFHLVESTFGGLDVLVANARPEAAEFFQGPMDLSVRQWDGASDSQGKAFLVSAREAARLMRAGGRILALT